MAIRRPPPSLNPALSAKISGLDKKLDKTQEVPPQNKTPEPPTQKPNAEAKVLSVSELAAKQNVHIDRSRGAQQSQESNDYLLSRQEVSTGHNFLEALNDSPEDEERNEDNELEPDPYLSGFESMKNVYLKVHGRASPKTLQLLEGPDLEDLVRMLEELHLTDELRRNTESRLNRVLYNILKDEPGPLLLGLSDERLSHPWRLFTEGWDIWVPDIESEMEDAEESGVELFWEGEAEDSQGQDIEITQTLSFESNSLRLHTKFGNKTDDLTFDGQTFFRLKQR